MTRASEPATGKNSSQITTETVEHLAGLARIQLTTNEIDDLAVEIGSILSHVEKVSEVAAAEVAPTSHPIAISNVMREDVINDVLTREQALMNAPEHADGMFVVSSILGEEQ